MITLPTIGLALFGGVVPALVWLAFWLREDRMHPEPRRYLILTFILGMVAVAIALPLERLMAGFVGNTLYLIITWAFIEESLKYIMAWIGGLRTCATDEPIDAVIYMITAALGFAALENTLFLLAPLADGNVVLTLLTGNIRFIGATLLHVVSSGIVGSFIAFSFYKNSTIRERHIIMGLFFAVTLHAIFNYLILSRGGNDIFLVFASVWVLIIGLIGVFERVKRIRRKRRQALVGRRT